MSAVPEFTTILFLNGPEAKIKTEFLLNSKIFLAHQKMFPDKQWISTYDRDPMLEYYRDYDEFKNLGNRNPYAYWHQMFEVANYLEDDYTIGILRDRIIGTLEQAYPKTCLVEVWLGGFCVMQFRCLKRDVVIARELAKLMREGELCVDYTAALLILSDPYRAEQIMGEKNKDITSLCPDCYGRDNIKHVLSQRILEQFHQVISSGLGTPSLLACTNLLKEEVNGQKQLRDLSQVICHNAVNLYAHEDGIFGGFYIGEYLSTYLQRLEEKAIQQPSHFLELFNQTQAIMYTNTPVTNNHQATPGFRPPSGIRTFFYTLVIDGQTKHTGNIQPGEPLVTSFGSIGMPGPLRMCQKHARKLGQGQYDAAHLNY